jgi:cytidyltransferase-like protein
MILSYEELEKYEKKVVMVDGCFDPLHIGHIKYFEVASGYGYPVFCNIQSDKYIRAIKSRPNILPEAQRVALIDSLKYISYVHLCNTSTDDILRRLKPIKYIKGMDWQRKSLPEIEKQLCSAQAIEIAYLDTNLDSSSNIFNTFAKNVLDMENLKSQEAFEKILFSQKEINAHYYDTHYFQGHWRHGDNNYSLEKRREMEGKNPFNIKEVFNPRCVLDVGCGPGALMYLLYELGIECYGIDFSPAARELAPSEVKEHIIVSPVTEHYEFGVNFDCVICRELLEHLTLLQIKKTIKTLADYTHKYLYVTTRFCTSPKTLLDTTDDTATDPTHITLLNKQFLRVLFMLEGLKPRPDLEEKLDWKKLGRVLVFEKV